MIKYFCDNQQCGVEIVGEPLFQTTDMIVAAVDEIAIENQLDKEKKAVLYEFLNECIENKIYCDTCRTTVKNNVKTKIAEVLGAVDGS
jgi:hypothetical protein